MSVRALGSARLWGEMACVGRGSAWCLRAKPARFSLVVLAHISLAKLPRRVDETGRIYETPEVSKPARAIPATCKVCGRGVESTGRPCIEPGSGQRGQ